MAATSPLTEQKRRLLRDEYTARINRVMDHIEKHLDRPLCLEDLARIAGFSPFHFHRIFSSMVGETLNQFIHRLRVEKAAAALIRNPKTSITEIAFESGFSGSASFARAFRESFGMSASEWRNGGYADHQIKKKRAAASSYFGAELAPDWGIISHRIDETTRLPTWRIRVKGMEPAPVVVKEIAEKRVAYVRYTGPYAGMVEVFRDIFDRLMRWAGPRGLTQDPAAEVLAVYHDSPSITEEDKLRVSACLTVPEDTRVDGEVGSMRLVGGLCAAGSFELGSKEYHLAWYAMMCGWLPESGYQPDDRPFYERFASPDRDDSTAAKTAVEICIPVRPL